MADKAYLLLNIEDGRVKETIETLQKSPGVTQADAIEGPPDVIAAIEAPGRQQLAEMVMRAIASVEKMTERVDLLPVRTESGKIRYGKSFGHKRAFGKSRN